MGWLKRLIKAREGSIAVLGALSLVSLIGMTSLAVEVGNGYAAKVRNQRVADVAALGAAMAYKASPSSDVPTKKTAAEKTAKDIIVANGLSSAVPDIVWDSSEAPTEITVSVQTSVPIKLASVLTRSATYNVTSAATASFVSPSTTGCITALGDNGITISADGGASIKAGGTGGVGACSVVTNGTIYSSNSSATITAKQIVAAAINDTSAQWGQNAITTTPTGQNLQIKPNQASDFVADNGAVKNALCYVNQLTGNSDTYDSVGNPNGYAGGNTDCTNILVKTKPLPDNGSSTAWSTDYGKKGMGGMSDYRTADYKCDYVIPIYIVVGNLNIGGGCTVKFQAGGSFRNVTMSGASLSFGDGNVTITGVLNINADNTVTMGNGAHSFGSITIGGGKTLRIGSGNFYLVNSLNLSGGAWIRVGISTGDTVTIGHDNSNNAIVVGGGSQVCFTSNCTMATAAAGTFSADGNVNVTGGGSLVVFPMAEYHVINGDLIATAGVLFGPGLYVIKGDFKNTVGSGSDSMNGTDVTFALGGTFNFAGGSHFDLEARSSSTGDYGIQDMLFLTKSSSATVLNAGSTGLASGMIYAPNSAFSSSGGSAILGGGQCMMLLTNTVTVTGSGTIYTGNCGSLGSASGDTNTVRLIR